MTLGAVLAVLVVHNLVTNLWAPERSYVPVNLATSLLVAVLAGGAGLAVGHSPGVGLAAALVVLGGIGLLAVHPLTRPFLADRRMAGVDARGTAWRALVRIPLGTVVLEEVAFRGVLPALTSPGVACALFGLWHVVPTARTLDVNGLARSRSTRVAAIAAAVLLTGVIGLVLWQLRTATGGLLAPALVHAAANSGAVVAAYAVLSRA